ncbi:OLC1v1036027C1 [Oldenlandia corymbosa var. corymbosa]|uniref:OLC1v1036027C1 n=1 Tax=Oldenlandia corymbosa var. corymbosa TaxID=529605 RepID=A0AAV1CXK5_OLDCO|nr:OLC1v1036027C1 [Oldenlandia corymbosa var. corymbosa]
MGKFFTANVMPQIAGFVANYKLYRDRLPDLWQITNCIAIMDQVRDYFLVKFRSKEDMYRVLNEGPWVILNTYLHVQPWDSSFDAGTTMVKSTIVWAKLPGLQDKPLVSQLEFRDMVQKVEYENVPPLCAACNRVGHQAGTCLCPVKNAGSGEPTRRRVPRVSSLMEDTVNRFEKFRLTEEEKGFVIGKGDVARRREECERNLKERDRVLSGGPWFFKEQLMVIHPWAKKLEEDKAKFDRANMWVQVQGLPSHWVSKEVGWKLGKLFPNCSNVLIPESGSKCGRIIKIYVEVELNKQLVRGTKLTLEGETRWLQFSYDNLPLYCYYCGHVGHIEKQCETKKEDAKRGTIDEEQFGDWLSARKLKMEIKNVEDRGMRDRYYGKFVPVGKESLDQNQQEDQWKGGRVGDSSSWVESGGQKVIKDASGDSLSDNPVDREANVKGHAQMAPQWQERFLGVREINSEADAKVVVDEITDHLWQGSNKEKEGCLLVDNHKELDGGKRWRRRGIGGKGESQPMEEGNIMPGNNESRKRGGVSTDVELQESVIKKGKGELVRSESSGKTRRTAGMLA